MQKKRKIFSMFLKTFWKPLSWAIIIIILSVMPTDKIDGRVLSVVPYQDKIMHFIFYGIFSFLLLRALLVRFKKSKSVWSLALVTFLTIFIFGLSLEIIQAKFTSYRQGDLFDMVSNLVGCIFAILLVLFVPIFRASSDAKQ
jgi:VanZ family protein